MVQQQKQIRVFYSWQDDTPRRDNRYFIEEALKKAIKALNKEDSTIQEIIIDRDTKGVPGAPLIAETILGKIDAASVFVADITIIGKAISGKPVNNPNVMAEFGYALKSLAHDALVLVANVAYGGITDLPFDLRHRRIMTYDLPPDLGTGGQINTRATIARELERDLEVALRLTLDSKPTTTLVPILESLRTRADNNLAVDYYDLRIKLKNNGPTTIKDFRIEVEIPIAFSNQASSSVAEVREHNRGDVKLYRMTERGHPGFTLYPDDTSDYIFLLDYQVTIDQYIQITGEEIIKVLLYSQENLQSVTHHRIADFLNQDRISQIWPDEWRRPQVLREQRQRLPHVSN